MGFLSTALGKSLFTEDSYKGAIGSEVPNGFDPGYAVIILRPSIVRSFTKDDIEPIVIGIIKDKIDLNYTAEWSPMGGFASVMQSVPFVGDIVQMGAKALNAGSGIVNMGGGADLGAVYSSKMIYHKSGYLRINPSFRVVNWQGNGDPLKASVLIASYCSPLEGDTSIIDTIKQLLKNFDSSSDKNTIAKQLSTLANQVGGTLKELVLGLEQKIENVGGQAATNIFNNITSDIEKDYLSIRSSPVPLQVTIGQYFFHPDMVLMESNLSFSKEMTKTGPLYVDISLTLVSRKIIGGVNDIGISKTVNRLIDIGNTDFRNSGGLFKNQTVQNFT